MYEIPLTSFRPVVTGTVLSKDKVVGAEEATKRTGADRVHGAGLEIDEDGTGDILVGLNFIVVNVDTLELEIVVALVDTVTVDAVFV